MREHAEEEVESPGRPLKLSPVRTVSFDDAGSLLRINQYQMLKPLGKGSFAEVYLCCDVKSKTEYAVKIFNKSLLRRKRTMERTVDGIHVHSELEKVEREIAIMKNLSHPNLVCLYEVIDDQEDDQLYMFIEYVEIGPVMTYDKAARAFRSIVTGGVCCEKSSCQYLLDIAAGLRFLHMHHIAHRDLKPDNVLLSLSGHVKIADFGVAHFFQTDANKAIQTVALLERSESRAQICETQGTYCFWAPEMVEVEKSFNAYACDMWAAGVCFYIFLAGELPFYDEAVTELFDKIRRADLTLPETLSQDTHRILTGLLQPDVRKRLTVQDLEADPFLERISATFVASDHLGNFATRTRSSRLRSPVGSPRTSRHADRPSHYRKHFDWSSNYGRHQSDIETTFAKMHTKSKEVCQGVMHKVYTITSSGTKRLSSRRKDTSSPRG
ncbi:hypothetical protein CTAYLR_006284 [Chrysophaeum taylorii]|uniref:Protein kinase domain-containing protein n=1 Tax=Chrysophaeum taylorii TaxID=2483200 RepID=A0AAD7XPZ9_9STRA|nr:hypothetical protein CTAYLR_006284 [Chrysophaeum taylorii]